ncbi:MAG TPA: PDZ domain-containing protein [Acidimicrobiia bacterium]|nr:PDZ domain-containing protein [Acidimicrobiia bacterium]
MATDPFGPLGAPPPPEPPKQPRMTRGAWWSLGISLFLGAVLLGGFLIHVPYTVISPGAAVPVGPLIDVKGARTYTTPRGDIRLLFVRERNHVNLWRYLVAKLDSDTDIIKDQVATGGLPSGDLRANDAADMADAKISATKVALEAAGYPIKAPDGLSVESVLPGRPAAKVLRAGDVIRAADGHAVSDGQTLRKAVAKHRDGSAVQLQIVRGGRQQTVSVKVVIDHNQPIIGVRVFPAFVFPAQVNVDTGGILGPSAGLAMTLAIFDDLTPGSLTGSTRVAVTGTIDPDGNVGEIGAIEQKAVAAKAAHARLFIVPKCEKADPPEQLRACEDDLQRAIKRAGSGVHVVPVGTFAEALAALRDAGGDPVTPATTTSTTPSST